MILGTKGLRMPLSKPPVSCGASLNAFTQKPMVLGAKTRAPDRWASSHLAVLYSMVVRMSRGLSIQRAERRCFLTMGTQAMTNTTATASAGRRRSRLLRTCEKIAEMAGLTDESVCPTCGAGAFACQPSLSQLPSLRTSGHTANIAATQRNMTDSRWYRSGCGSSDSLNHIAPSAVGASSSETSNAKRVWRASFQRAMAHAASRNAAATTRANLRCVKSAWKLLATRGALARMTAMVAGDSHGTAMAYA